MRRHERESLKLADFRTLLLAFFRGERHQFPSALGLFLLQRTDDLPHVVTVRFGQAIPNSSRLFDNRVTSHADHSISSSGVQMIGGSNPASRHVRSILSRIAAFAMCVQFHVST